MARYIIGCTMTSPGRDYIDFTEAVAALGEFWPCTPSLWIVTSERSASDIRDELKPHLGPNDDLVVAELSGRAAWRGADPHFSEGLKKLFSPQRLA